MVKPRKGALIQTLVCPPFGVCGQGFPLAILRLPDGPTGPGYAAPALRSLRAVMGCLLARLDGLGRGKNVRAITTPCPIP